MLLTVYTSFKCNFAGLACKIAFETSINSWDEPLSRDYERNLTELSIGIMYFCIASV
ncbi:MAG: hypothetical protein NVSMB44_41520 [Ktedonobacteraceae bacterium]